MLAAHYKQQGEEGILALHGTVDIFEAQAVHAAASEALAHTQALAVCLDTADVQRLDLSALQILAALRRDLEMAGRGLRVPHPEHVTRPEAARAGLCFSDLTFGIQDQHQ